VPRSDWRAELQETIKHAGVGAGLFGTAGILALCGLGVVVAAAVLALALVLDAWLAAVIVAVALFAMAGVATLGGRSQVEHVAPPLRTSVDNVKRDTDLLKERN
jgi:hypothetical protein